MSVRPTTLLRRFPRSIKLPATTVQSHRPVSSSPCLANKRAAISKPPAYGQPLALTHPHLLSGTQLTPGIETSEYEQRRRNLMESIPEGGLVIAMGARIQYSSQNIFYKFRQATDFFYLTGWNEPDSALILRKDSSLERGYEMILFVPIRSSTSQLWEGGRSSVDGAVEFFGADNALPLNDLNSTLSSLVPSTSSIYVDLPTHSPSSKRSFLSLLHLGSPPTNSLAGFEIPSAKISSLADLVQKLRKVKSPAEAAIMKKAGDISSKGFVGIMQLAKPGMSEATLAAYFEFACALEGSERPAYVPVVASGSNALCIHYTDNNQLLADEEMVLVDAGCELHSYCSDITRTFPVSGKFTDPQRDLYEAVLEVNKRCIKMCKASEEISPNALHQLSVRYMREALLQIGFDVGDRETRELYPHALSHYLGMDLHDTPSQSKESSLVNGNVITIEPGIYVPHSSSFPKHFRGMGIRIEDDILITPDGPLVLTSHCPKEVIDVEAACQSSLSSPL